MQYDHSVIKLDGKRQDFLCRRSESLYGNTSSNAVFKVKYDLLQKKCISDDEWQIEKRPLNKSNSSFMVSTSTNLNLLFVDKKEKILRNSTITTNYSHSPVKNPTFTEKAKKFLNSHLKFDKIKGNESPLQADKSWTHSNSLISDAKIQRKSSMCLMEFHTKQSSNEYESESFHTFSPVPLKAKQALRHAGASWLALNKSLKPKPSIADILFPEIKQPLRSLDKPGTDLLPPQKSFHTLKALPLYRITIENNTFAKIRLSKGQLK